MHTPWPTAPTGGVLGTSRVLRGAGVDGPSDQCRLVHAVVAAPTGLTHDLLNAGVGVAAAPLGSGAQPGLDVKVVQARLRHASATTTLNVYGHLFPDADETSRAAESAVLAMRLVSPSTDTFTETTMP